VGLVSKGGFEVQDIRIDNLLAYEFNSTEVLESTTYVHTYRKYEGTKVVRNDESTTINVVLLALS
jgi:hypothetical protein